MVGGPERQRAVGEERVFAGEADAAAMRPRAGAVGQQLVALHPDRVLGLHDLDRRPRREMVHRHQDGGAVARAGAAERCVHQLVLDGRLAGAPRRIADRHGTRPEPGRRDRARRVERPERGEHHVVDHVRGREIMVHGRRELRAHDPARRDDEVDRFEGAGIHRDRRIGGGEDRLHRDRARGRLGRVDRAGGLRIAAAEIERQAVARLLHPDMDTHRPVAVGPVMVHQPLGLGGAVRPAGNRRPHPVGGPDHQRVHGPGHDIRAERLAELRHAPCAEPGRAHLATQIADHHVGYPAVVADDRLDFGVDAVGGPHADRRHQESVMEDLARRRAGRTRHQPADIGLVGDAHPEGDQPSLVEGGRRDHEIGDVAVARLVGVVADEAVAVAHGLRRVALEDAADRLGIEQRMVLQPAADHDHAAGAVGQPRGAVLGFAENRRVAAMEQRMRHRLGGLAQAAQHHLDGDRIQAHGVSPAAMTRLPCASTVALWPDRTTVVESNCWITAAPSIRSPARSRARS